MRVLVVIVVVFSLNRSDSTYIFNSAYTYTYLDKLHHIHISTRYLDGGISQHWHFTARHVRTLDIIIVITTLI